MRFEQHLSQQQKQTQKLAMTMQMKQSIQMLQYNTPDLLSFLENKALENPLLEVDLPMMDTTSYSSTVNRTNEEEHDWLLQVPDRDISLFDFLIQQIHLNYRETSLRKLSLFLVEYIDSNGYLTITLEDASRLTGASEVALLDALRLIQILEPVGVGARDLQECLMLQTERDEEAPELAYLVLEEHFEDLANRKWSAIEKDYQLKLSDIQRIFDYLQKLTPFPGAAFSKTEEQFIIPDLLVTIIDKEIKVRRTKESQPKVTFQQHYFDKMLKSGDKEVKDYLANRKSEYDWIKRSLTQRGDTILRIGQSIVAYQKEFFVDPSRPLQPLQMKQVAKELSIHESTVSRSVNGKYLQTSFGIFELKMFFPMGLKQTNPEDGEVATGELKKELMKIVENEDKRKPLSDQKIVEELKNKQYKLSRRTVAKYREELGIASSSKRKRYDEK
ncbi:RNA polymerase factor sigma-54 [Vagococcus sp.]|uniref:RNA polymerase factor sigma-54 n=1 Tax=Vagococcus sp. TaxID=1933889 RepID=UPI003F976A4B